MEQTQDKMKQVTLKVEGYVTVTVRESCAHPDSIPVKIEAFTMNEHEDSWVEEVHEIEVTNTEVVTEVDV